MYLELEIVEPREPKMIKYALSGHSPVEVERRGFLQYCFNTKDHC